MTQITNSLLIKYGFFPSTLFTDEKKIYVRRVTDYDENENPRIKSVQYDPQNKQMLIDGFIVREFVESFEDIQNCWLAIFSCELTPPTNDWNGITKSTRPTFVDKVRHIVEKKGWDKSNWWWYKHYIRIKSKYIGWLYS